MAVVLHILFEETSDDYINTHPSIDAQADNFTSKELTTAIAIAKTIMRVAKENDARQQQMKTNTKIPPGNVH